jgi:uncharacterized protein YndB with AHSA1/START domain
MQMVVYQSVKLNCNAEKAFEMFTVNEYLQSWLTELANVEPKLGGKYELFWDPADRENNSTIGCKITAIEKNKFLGFEWKGPPQFKHFMNTAVPLTHVIVFFMPCGDVESGLCSEVYLIHSGWGDSAEWQEAKSYFDKAWLIALKNLKGKFITDNK